ncbi:MULTISPECIES: hypothetical protein [unclassified Kitasatospora]|uniref:hypothetical protein n=1 Tax=unclassified Kitasatospora TaxID=2633591 RepID=UPI00247563DC|nr:hypothetical protein [Kitasatospora sp. MAP12-44]
MAPPSAPPSAAAPGAYKLVAPATLPGGYSASKAPVVHAGSTSVMPPGFSTFDGNVIAPYTKGDHDFLSVSGSWGTIADPATEAAKVSATALDARATWAQPLAAFDAKDPHDSEGRLSCGVTDTDTNMLPVCIWANHSTVGSVSFTLWLDGMDPSITMAQAAERTRAIRDAMTISR